MIYRKKNEVTAACIWKKEALGSYSFFLKKSQGLRLYFVQILLVASDDLIKRASHLDGFGHPRNRKKHGRSSKFCQESTTHANNIFSEPFDLTRIDLYTVSIRSDN